MIESGGYWIVPKESYREKGVGVPFLDLRRVRPSWVASLVASTNTPEAELLSGSRSYHTNAQVLWYYITSVVVLLRFDIVPIQCSIMEWAHNLHETWIFTAKTAVSQTASKRRNFDFAFQDTKCGCWMMNLDIMWINMDMKVFGLCNYTSWVNQKMSNHSESVSTFKFAILFQKHE